MQHARVIEFIAGQRIMAGFIGTELNEDLKFLIDTIGVGGIILFSRNITSRKQLTSLCKNASEYASACSLPPLLIAIDQEGGTVARLKAPYFTEFPGAPFIKNISDAETFARITAEELCDAGINMDMAQVLDVAPKDFDSVMSQRMFGNDPRLTSMLGCTIIKHLQASGVMAVAKHFPGIGRTTLDSHLERPDLDASFESLESFDLIPFQAAIESGVSGIMLSHVRYTAIDPKWPASLSPDIALDLLRKKMGYTGVVMTDDLEMGAVEKHYNMGAMTRQLIDSEIDIALICKTRQKIEDAFEHLCRHLSKESDSLKKADRSIKRIAELKRKNLSAH
jgi:beta-N-acetylhexosaminidase